MTCPDQVSLKDHAFDDGFTDLVRDKDGRATFSVQAGDKKIQVIYGPKYQVAVVYAPPAQNFICFEPMTAITNGVNLAHDGKYAELETVAPGESWQEASGYGSAGFEHGEVAMQSRCAEPAIRSRSLKRASRALWNAIPTVETSGYPCCAALATRCTATPKWRWKKRSRRSRRGDQPHFSLPTAR